MLSELGPFHLEIRVTQLWEVVLFFINFFSCFLLFSFWNFSLVGFWTCWVDYICLCSCSFCCTCWDTSNPFLHFLFWEFKKNFYSSSGSDHFLYIANCSWFTGTVSLRISLRTLIWGFFFKFSSVFFFAVPLFSPDSYPLVLYLWSLFHFGDIPQMWSLVVHLYLRVGDTHKLIGSSVHGGEGLSTLL